MAHRLATYADLDRIMEIIAAAQRYLKACGVDQWQDGYPQRELFEQDIEKGCCHVFLADEAIAGVITLLLEPETDYDTVEGGAWLSGDVPYAAFHRAAVDDAYRKKGISVEMISFAENLAKQRGLKSLRGDTHRDNKAMQGLLKKCGFTPCGIIYLGGVKSEKTARICFEKLL